MKKWLAYILLPVLLLCAAGCHRGDPTTPPIEPGVDVQIANVDTNGGDVTLKVLWRNQTACAVTYGEPYAIERLENGQWVSCAKQEKTAFITIGYGLNAFDTVYKTYKVSDLFDVTAPGTYRFRSSCSLQTDKGDYESCKVMAEFTLNDQESPSSQDHTHKIAPQPQTVKDPVSGYCGNTRTTLYIGQQEYSFMYGHSVTLTDLLVNLDYDPDHVCRCMPQYRVDTEFGKNYHIHLDYGFVRCDKGQADLTQEQIDTIAEIIEWAETTNCEYPLTD